MDLAQPAVLLVDDDEGVHLAVGRTLRGEPYELVHAFDVAEARALLESRADIRAIVCDHYMPGEPGLDFMLEVRATRPELIAILLTAQADVGMVIAALGEGQLHRFYTKPWDGDEMRADLRALLGLPSDAAATTWGRGHHVTVCPTSASTVGTPIASEEWIAIAPEQPAETSDSARR
jgi:DNA-binding NtrC family response regulator